MYNLLQTMFSTLWGDEQQPKRHEVGTRSVVEVVKHETESAAPTETSEIQSKTTTRSKTKHDIDGDIKRLEEVFFGGHPMPMQSGFIIETTLHDLLAVCPRERRRKDAYKSLIHALNKMGVELIIKTK